MYVRYVSTFLTIASCLLGASFNEENIPFYEEVGEKQLSRFAAAAGLTSGCDVARIASYIKDASVILEIGAGYGRAAGYIHRQMAPHATLYLVENAPGFLSILEQKFASKAQILPKDVKTLSIADLPNGQVDLALWLFSGISDCNWEEQKVALSTLISLMSSKGLLIIDLPFFTAKSNVTNITEVSDRGMYAEVGLENSNTLLRVFIPSEKGIGELAETTGWFLEKAEKYVPEGTTRTRVQYFLRAQKRVGCAISPTLRG